MPTERVHLAQLRHNLAFLRSFYAPDTPYPDWAVTVAFYAAVHAVEAWLAQRGLHSHSHRERGIYLRQFLPHLWHPYRRLELASRNARYEGVHPSPTLLRQLIDHDLPTLLSALGIVP
jgi:hypothetical protein